MPLTREETAVLQEIQKERLRVPANTHLIQESDESGMIYVFLHGWGIRYRKLKDGRRQILNFVLPGDFCDAVAFVTRRNSHGILTITSAEVAEIESEVMFSALIEQPRLAATFWWLEAQEEALLREHVVAVGRRSARERLCYLIWETHRRLSQVGLAAGHSFAMPVTQRMLADALGLTAVHVSRVLGRLEQEGLLRMRSGGVTILRPEAIQELGEVRGAQLHHEGVPDRLRSYLQPKH